MKTKIVFAGVMGAILMSAGANAATTSVATKGYVDQQVKGVQTTINNLGDTYATTESVTNAINDAVTDLNLGDTYEVLANKVNAISASMSEQDKTTKYPTVKAVLDAMPTLTEADKQAIADLTGENGLITRVGKVESAVETLNGADTVEGSVAKSIADAISTHTTAADAKYQAQSTADLQIGTTGGKFRDMTVAEKAALASGVTAEKVTAYDALTGDTGTVAELQKAIDGLNGEDGTITTINTTVTELQTVVGDETAGLVADVAANTAAITANTAAIANKITMPADCASGNKVCVLMVSDGTVSWTPVTSPVEDPVTGGITGE